MACCVVAAFLLALTHWLAPWRRRGPDAASFAPVAMRPAPGAPGVVPTPPAQVAPPVRQSGAVAAAAWILRFAALGAIAYVVLVAALCWSDLAMTHAPPLRWWLRSAVIVVLAVIGNLAAARLMRRGSPEFAGRQIAGFTAVGIASSMIVGTAVDVDLLHLYHVHHPLLHGVLHMGAVVVLAGGALALLLPGRSGLGSEVVWAQHD